jgi:tetratricopeptide (TPR) repeat protein
MKALAKLKDEARKHEAKEEWQKAIDAYVQVINQAEGTEDGEQELPLYNRVGDLYVRLGKPADAVTFYERAADQYGEAGLFNNAIALCNKALRYLPNRLELIRKLGQFSAAQGFITDARRNYLDYAERQIKAGHLDDAFKALEDFASVHEDVELRELLGRYLKSHARPEKAVIELTRAYKLRQQAGDHAAAAKLKQEVLEINPNARVDDDLPPPKSALPSAAAAQPALETMSWEPASTGNVELAGASDLGLESAAGAAFGSDFGSEPSAGLIDLPGLDIPETALPGAIDLETTELATASSDALEGGLIDLDSALPPLDSELPLLEDEPVTELPLLDMGSDDLPGFETETISEGADLPLETFHEEPAASLNAMDFGLEELETEIAGEPASLPLIDLGIEAPTEELPTFEEPPAGPLPGFEPEPETVPEPEPEPMMDDAGLFDLTVVLGKPLQKEAEAPPVAELEPVTEPEPLLEAEPIAEIEPALDVEPFPVLETDLETTAPEPAPPELIRLEQPEVIKTVEEPPAPPPSMRDDWELPPPTFPRPEPEPSFAAPDVMAEPEPPAAEVISEPEPPELETPVAAAPVAEVEPEREAEPAVVETPVEVEPFQLESAADRIARGRGLLDRGETAIASRYLDQLHRELEGLGQFREAWEAANEMMRLDPGSLSLLQQRIDYAEASGDRDLMARSWLDLAHEQKRSGQDQKARSSFQRVLELSPGNTEATEALAPPPAPPPPPPPPAPAPAAVAPAKKGKSDYIDLASFLEDDEQPDSSRFVVAEKPPTGDEERDFADMLSQFKQKVSEHISVDDASAHYDLGLAFKEMGLIDEAIAEFQTAMKGGEPKLKVYEELGQCFLLKQQYTIALNVLNRALQMPVQDEGDLIGVYYALGRAHEELGHGGDAKSAYERVISLDINFQDTNQRLSKL